MLSLTHNNVNCQMSIEVCYCYLVQLFSDPMDCTLPGSSIHGISTPGKNTRVGCHFLLQGNLPDPGIKPASPALAGGFFTTEPPGNPDKLQVTINHKVCC